MSPNGLIGVAAPGTRGRVLDPLYEAIGWAPPAIVDFLIAVLVVVAGWYLAKLLVRIAGRPVAHRFGRPSITRTVLQSMRVGVLVVATVIAARILGVQAGEILLSVTVFSAVLAVVLAPIVGSFISGLFVLADQPFEIGDMIELVDEDTRGYVEDITLRYTKMFTLDNTFIVIPNSTIRDRDIINYSAEDERTRQRLELVVTYEGDLDRAREIAEQAARKADGVIGGGPAIRIGSTRYPAAPTTHIDQFGDHGVHISLRYWVQKPYRLPAVRSEIQEHIWTALEDADVEIAYPHSHIVFDDTSGEAAVSVRPTGSMEATIGDDPTAGSARSDTQDVESEPTVSEPSGEETRTESTSDRMKSTSDRTENTSDRTKSGSEPPGDDTTTGGEDPSIGPE